MSIKSKFAICKAGLLMVAGLVFFEVTASHATPQMRTDMGARLASMICGGTFAERPEVLWDHEIYDAQIEGLTVRAQGGATIDLEAMTRRGKALAAELHHHGLASGVCGDGVGWVAVLPAPRPVQRSAGEVTLPYEEMQRLCRHWRVDFAATTGGAAAPLPAGRGIVSTGVLKDGVISVSCQQKAPQWLGPQLWYLVPVGKGAAREAPHARLLRTGDQETALRLWIDQIRTAASLPPLRWDDAVMAREAAALAVGGSLAHDRVRLRRARKALQSEKFRLLGEDRVKGRTIESLAWLLWHSPLHRDLLIDRRASTGALSLQENSGTLFAVIVIAEREKPASAATGTQPRKM